jgi:hypothetical protein
MLQDIEDVKKNVTAKLDVAPLDAYIDCFMQLLKDVSVWCLHVHKTGTFYISSFSCFIMFCHNHHILQYIIWIFHDDWIQ